MLSPTRSKKLIDSFYGGEKESLVNPPLLRLQGHDAKRSGPLEIMAELGGVQRNVVIDTGAEINVIARDFVWQNGWKNMVKEQKNEILGISNQVITADGKLVLEVSIRGATVPVEFLVLPINNIYAILGIEFIKAHDVELKFNGNESIMKWRPNKKEKLRQVPLSINTHAPHLGVWKKVNSTEEKQNNNVSEFQTTPTPEPTPKSTRKEKNEPYRAKSTTGTGRALDGLPSTQA